MKKFYFQGKIYLIKILSVLILFLATSISAQEIITEHTSKNVEANLKYKPSFDQNNYKKGLDKNDSKVFLKKADPNQTANNENAKANASLTFNFTYDTNEYFISSFLVFSEAGYKFAGDYNNVTNPLVLNVPTGSYDIITEFSLSLIHI